VSRGWIVFEVLSTASIVTLAAIAIRRELRESHAPAGAPERSILGRDRGLGLPAAEHRERVRKMGPALEHAKADVDKYLRSRRCDLALERVVDYATIYGAVQGHRDRAPTAHAPVDKLMARYRAACG
jgi:hypothetical protein